MSLAGEEDIEVIADVTDETEISRAIEQATPEFLIVSLDSRRFGSSAREDMLQKYPAMQIMALANDGNSFILFSASDGIRSMTYEGPEADILEVMRSNSRRESE